MIELSELPEAWLQCIEAIRPALVLAPRSYLEDVRERLAMADIIGAVESGNTPTIFDWIVRLLARQGIGNHAAEVFLARNGSPSFDEIADLLARGARCPRLRCRWSFEDCGYRRSAETCSTPHHLVGCAVEQIPARKGALAEAAIGLWLFVRDCCDGDLVSWLDKRLAGANMPIGDPRRFARMRAAVLDPLVEIPGTGRKVWSMILAELLLGGDPDRPRWVEVGASFVAVDSLVHAYLHRTGLLRRLGADHLYGPACYGPDGCSKIIELLASLIDAREFDASFPACFPRWIQFAIWWFCAADGWSICNGTKIDDETGCRQQFCPAFGHCARLPN